MQRFRHQIIPYFILLTGIAGSAAGGIQFTRENIAVSVLPPDTVMVRGEYFFCAGDTAPISIRLYYPFPVDSAAGFPFYINVGDKRTVKEIGFSLSGEGISFQVSVKAGDTSETVVVYKQRVKNRTGRYILTTTGAWNAPLRNSRYSVSIPKTMTLAYMSYECDSVVTSGNRLVYQFFKKEFMPDRDLVFTWKSP